MKIKALVYLTVWQGEPRIIRVGLTEKDSKRTAQFSDLRKPMLWSFVFNSKNREQLQARDRSQTNIRSTLGKAVQLLPEAQAAHT